MPRNVAIKSLRCKDSHAAKYKYLKISIRFFLGGSGSQNISGGKTAENLNAQ